MNIIRKYFSKKKLELTLFNSFRRKSLNLLKIYFTNLSIRANFKQDIYIDIKEQLSSYPLNNALDSKKIKSIYYQLIRIPKGVSIYLTAFLNITNIKRLGIIQNDFLYLLQRLNKNICMI